MSPDVFSMLNRFQEDRPVMDRENSDVNMLLSFMAQEVEELVEAVEGNFTPDYISEEAVDVVFFALAIARLFTDDIEGKMREKIAMNTMRYEAHLFQGQYTYEEARRLAKEGFTSEDKEAFYSDELPR